MVRWIALGIGLVAGGASGWLVHAPRGGGGVAAGTRGAAEGPGGVAAGARGAEEGPGGVAAGTRGAAEGPGGVAAATPGAKAHAGAATAGEAHEAPRHTPAVATALEKWAAGGRAQAAARALRAAGAAALAEAVEAIDANRRAGQSAFLEGDLEGAAARWGEAFRREEELGLPRPTAASLELRRRLADAWHRRALVHEERGQLREARACWAKAVAADPAHLDGLAGLQRLALREQGGRLP